MYHRLSHTAYPGALVRQPAGKYLVLRAGTYPAPATPATPQLTQYSPPPSTMILDVPAAENHMDISRY
ncbi:hypothetical protein IF1G_04947 [Cordyceps javanica]|uniref:Uncharacterized protein n=1 Tax=Cordyceps javanica TaxID=43265 RepID=A0A545V3R8_9HYPO|nr:hypothetical protein IF1G_04947 [Cordyceps javanica]